jgi:hydroxymethylbilane synthase
LLDSVDHERLGASFVPAPGQGALAVTARDGEIAQTINHELDHPRTRVETTVERTILGTLGGGCVAPVGIHAVIQGEYVHAKVRVLSQDGTEEISATRDLPVETHPEAAREFAEGLAEEGAAELIERARRET